MAARNTRQSYGWVTRAFHWTMALYVFGMFGLGIWMRTLGYYDPWYQPAPELHKALGIVLIALFVLRVIWRAANPQPLPLSTQEWERRVGEAVHWALYLLILALAVTGYLYSTGDGKAISVFGLFELPVLIQLKPLADFAGNVHEILAYAIIALAALHAMAALKHHFVDRDATLRRMVLDAPHSQLPQSKGD